jgi:hypothetical protein
VSIMAEHEPCIGLSSDWFTPPEIFAALGLEFDLDPCSPDYLQKFVASEIEKNAAPIRAAGLAID